MCLGGLWRLSGIVFSTGGVPAAFLALRRASLPTRSFPRMTMVLRLNSSSPGTALTAINRLPQVSLIRISSLVLVRTRKLVAWLEIVNGRNPHPQRRRVRHPQSTPPPTAQTGIATLMRQKFILVVTTPALIVAAAFALRIGFAWQQQLHIAHRAVSTIPFLFEPGNIAYAIVTGHGFSSPLRDPTGPTAWTTPVYPYLLAGIFRLYGAYTFQSFVAALALNITFSALTCVQVFYVGKKLGGVGAGAGAAWLWALFPNAIILPFQSVTDASLSALLAATILWATLELSGSARSNRDACAYGLLWGFALMTNATLLALLPFLLVWLALREAQHNPVGSAKPIVGEVIAKPAMVAAIALLCCVPWTIRNYYQMHAFVPLRSVFGLQLWLGNNDRGPAQWPGRLHPIDNSAERALYESQGEIAYMHQKKREGVDFIRSHPLRTAHSIAGRIAATWTAETSTGAMPHPIRDFWLAPKFWPGYVLAWNLGVPIAALAGSIVLLRRRNRYALPVAVFPLVFPVTYYFTLVQPRYRHPIDPVLMILASYFVWGRAERDSRFGVQKTYTEL